MRLKSKVKAISFVLAAIICIEIAPLEYLGGLIKAFAAGTITTTEKVTYSPVGGITDTGSTYYRNSETIKANVNIQPPKPGMLISKITENLIDGGTKDVTGTAKDQSSYNGELTLYGKRDTVYSQDNDSAKGYYAWWRNPPGSSPKWYADLICEDGSSKRVSYGSTEMESVNGKQMSVYPGITSDQIPGCQNMKMSASRNKDYKLTDQTTIPPEAVAEAHVTKKK